MIVGSLISLKGITNVICRPNCNSGLSTDSLIEYSFFCFSSFTHLLGSTTTVLTMVSMISMSQEEIIANTKTVVQGLEALKNENCSILSGLLQSLKMVKETSKGDVNTRLMEEKASIVKKSIESIELGLNEAHVSDL